MSGKRIDDHSWWGGARSKGSVFPEGAKCKEEMSADGAGHLGQYFDTTEKIKEVQDMGEKKMRSHEMKPGYRY